ncbi:MAG TPA: hypothetical protein VMW35_20330 [Myxococcota bacterium]|nr:hypothetical protein [Myxococcota bacterium]
MTRDSAWAARAERGSLAALRLLRFAYRALGRRTCQLLLYPIVAYFFVTGRGTRAASLDYLRAVAAHPDGRRALAEEPSRRLVFAHLHEFARHLLDRFAVWSGAGEDIVIDRVGEPELKRAFAEGRGGILVGAHFGSLDMLRELSNRSGPTVNVLMFTRHAARINAFFEQLDPRSRLRVIEFDPGSVRAAFEIKQCVDRTEFVGISGDRLWRSARERSLEVPFLGRPARFPLGPFMLQTVLGCPLLFAVCVRVGPGHYETRVRRLSPPGPVPRRERAKRAEELAVTFVRCLEEICLELPLQWFNFYPFWNPDEAPR